MFKKLLNKILYEEVEVDDEEEAAAAKPADQTPSKPITLEKEPSQPAAAAKKEPVSKPQPVSDETAAQTRSSYITLAKQDQPVPVNPQPAAPSVKTREPNYTVHKVISPLFGYTPTADSDNKEAEAAAPVKNDQPAVEEPRSVLGTVFSPVYGSGKTSETVEEDEIDPAIANMTVQDIITSQPAVSKPVRPAMVVTPSAQPDRSEAEDRQAEQLLKADPIKVIVPQGNEALAQLAAQTLQVHPGERKQTPADNMSLFDDEDK